MLKSKANSIFKHVTLIKSQISRNINLTKMDYLPLTMESLNPKVKKVQYAVRGPIVSRASEIEKELSQGDSKPFEKVIKANIGDSHAVGGNPITFIRQVVAGCTYPPILNQGVFPSDVVHRCNEILNTVNDSIGCYSPSSGLDIIRKHIATFIENRDGYACDERNIIISNGASSAIKLVLELFQSDTENVGVMIPIPQYPLYSATVDEFGMTQIGYYLNEDRDWGLDISELKRAVDEARLSCNPRVLCIINPGNPTGQVFTYENIKDIITFAKEEGLFLMADEVYQDNVYKEGAHFNSFKKVLHDMGLADGYQMASFHSCSKGFMGECGLRGGYVEVLGFEPPVLAQLQKLQSAQLGSNVVGQLVMDCVTNPPKEGDPSYKLFMEEKASVLNSLKERATMVTERLNQIAGISCNEVAGAMYAFPKIHLSNKAIEAAKELNQEPDFFYCLNLLEETGICVVPGSGFKQQPGTYHFRMTILPSIDELKIFLEKIEKFHLKFMEKYLD